jgi:hypothetical protein
MDIEFMYESAGQVNIADIVTQNTTSLNKKNDDSDIKFSDFLNIDKADNLESKNSVEDYYNLTRPDFFYVQETKKKESNNILDDQLTQLFAQIPIEYHIDNRKVDMADNNIDKSNQPKQDIVLDRLFDKSDYLDQQQDIALPIAKFDIADYHLDQKIDVTHSNDYKAVNNEIEFNNIDNQTSSDNSQEFYKFLEKNIIIENISYKFPNYKLDKMTNNGNFEQDVNQNVSIDNVANILSEVSIDNTEFDRNTNYNESGNNEFSSNKDQESTDNIFSINNNFASLSNGKNNNQPNISKIFDDNFISKFNDLQPEIKIQKIINSEDNFIIVKLNPEELGEITFTVDMKDNIPIAIEASANSQETLSLIEKYATELKESLFRNGLADDIAMEFNLGNNNKNHSNNKHHTAQILDNILLEENKMIAKIDDYNIYQPAKHSSQLNLIV